MQFKYERLTDFCYKCDFINHVTDRCFFKEPARVTIGSGVSTRLYGPWLRAKEKGSILFVNPVVETSERKNLLEAVNGFSGEQGLSSKIFLFDERNRREREVEEVMPEKKSCLRKDDSKACFQNALVMLLELEALFVTSNRQSLLKERDLKEAVITQLRKYELENSRLNEWALKFLKVIATAIEFEILKFQKFGPKVKEWLGLGSTNFCPLSGPRDNLQLLEPITHNKRQAQVFWKVLIKELE